MSIHAANDDYKYNIGLYGGTFDPPHKAHRFIAQQSILELTLRHLYVRPVGSIWYKDKRNLTSAQHRLEMARLNFRKLPRCHIDDTEANNPDPSYTIDALQQLRQEHPDARIWLIMGGDQVAKLHTWKEWGTIPELANLAYLKRESNSSESIKQERQNRSAFEEVHKLTNKTYPISSTKLRKDIARQGPDSALAKQYLMPEVRRYILKNRLYARMQFESGFASLL